MASLGAQLYKLVKIHQIKHGHIIICKLYLNKVGAKN